MAEADCVYDFFPCSLVPSGNLLLMLGYGYLIAKGSKLIADGSELLMEILSPGVIGGLLLPLLGAFPDACIIFVACLGPDLATVQKQLSVGVGALAGSTVMVLTVPWAFSIYAGRCDIDPSTGTAKQKISTTRSLTESGVTVEGDVAVSAKMMLLTAVTYLVVQGPAIAYTFGEPHLQHKRELIFALTGSIMCLVLFIGYSVFQVYNTKAQERQMQEARQQVIMQKVADRLIALVQARTEAQSPKSPDIKKVASVWRTRSVRSTDKGTASETQPLLNNGNGDNGDATTSAQTCKDADRALSLAARLAQAEAVASKVVAEKEEIVEKEEEEQESSGLSPTQIAIRAAAYLVGGTLVCSVFSDPLVDSITQFSDEINVSSFFVAFVFAPLASNATELIAAIIFASKKTKKSISLTYGSLYGAASMNNTLCLGVFLSMVYIRKLRWDFSAEVASILFVEVVVALLALKTTLRLWKGIVVGCLYVAAIGLVSFLESPLIDWK